MNDRYKRKEKLAKAGYGLTEDGRPDGYHISWLHQDKRTFSDVLIEWVSCYKSIAAFLHDTGLEVALSETTLTELMAGTKVPAKELTNLLSALIPEDIIPWIMLRNRGYKAASYGGVEQVPLSQEMLSEVRSRHLKKLADASLETKNKTYHLTSWLADKIEAVAQKQGISADRDKSFLGLAKAVGLTVEQLTGRSAIKPSLIQEKARELISLLNMDSTEYDVNLKFITEAWSRRQELSKSSMPMPQALRFLRHTLGMAHLQFAAQSDFHHRELFSMESGNKGLSNLFRSRMISALSLTGAEIIHFNTIVDRHTAALGELPYSRPDEVSASVISNQYAADRVVVNKQIRKLRKRLIDDIVESGVMGLEEATNNVDHFLIGMRRASRGPATLFMTPDGSRIWQDIYKKKKMENIAPLVGVGEKSATALSKEYIGGAQRINKQLKMLRDVLIQEVQEQECLPKVKAVAFVDTYLIGMRKTRIYEALHATPAAIRIWEQVCEPTRVSDTPRDACNEDQSASHLAEIYKGGEFAIKAELKELRTKLIDDITSSGIMDAETARSNVDYFLIGDRTFKDKQGKRYYRMAATSDGMRTWEEAYQRRKKTDNTLEK